MTKKERAKLLYSNLWEQGGWDYISAASNIYGVSTMGGASPETPFRVRQKLNDEAMQKCFDTCGQSTNSKEVESCKKLCKEEHEREREKIDSKMKDAEQANEGLLFEVMSDKERRERFQEELQRVQLKVLAGEISAAVAIYFLFKLLDRLKPRFWKGPKVYTTILIITMITSIAINIYRYYFTKYAKACKKYYGHDYDLCMIKARIIAQQNKIKVLQDAIKYCMKSKNPSECSRKLRIKISKAKDKLAYYETIKREIELKFTGERPKVKPKF